MLKGLFQEKYGVIVWKGDSKGNSLTNQSHSILNNLTIYIVILVAFILSLEKVIGFIFTFEKAQQGNIMLNLWELNTRRLIYFKSLFVK